MTPLVGQRRVGAMQNDLRESVVRFADRQKSRYRTRRGSATALGIIMIGAMAVMLGMTIDLAHIHVSQGELRRTSDAAALAACWSLFDSRVNGLSYQNTATQVSETADTVSKRNQVAHTSPTVADNSENVVIGHFDWTSNQFSTNSLREPNAVRVLVHRQSDSNGEVPLFFGTILGRQSQPMSSTSTAALLHNISGFHTPASEEATIDILPFALDECTWNAVIEGQTVDNYDWQDDRLITQANGYHECNLYPQGTGSPGNRGTVDIGSSNNSTRDISRQIVDGISREDLLQMDGGLQLDHNCELFLNGDTGISWGKG